MCDVTCYGEFCRVCRLMQGFAVAGQGQWQVIAARFMVLQVCCSRLVLAHVMQNFSHGMPLFGFA